MAHISRMKLGRWFVTLRRLNELSQTSNRMSRRTVFTAGGVDVPKWKGVGSQILYLPCLLAPYTMTIGYSDPWSCLKGVYASVAVKGVQ